MGTHVHPSAPRSTQLGLATSSSALQSIRTCGCCSSEVSLWG